jgi:hypothetical protein
MPETSHETAHLPQLATALRRLLKPLVRLAIHYGLTFPALAEILKGIYVEVADEQFRLDAKRQTDSRVSMLTGVHRKDVKRLRGAGAHREDAASPKSVSLGAQIVGVWSSQPEYLDAGGEPRALPRLSTDESQASFDSLVRSVSRDIRSRVVLDEWLRLGVAEVDEEDRVRLNRAAFVPASGFDEKAFYLAQNLHDHAAAAASNLVGEGAPFLERCVHYDGVSSGAIPALAKAAESWGMRALRAVNSNVLQSGSAEPSDDRAWRINFGVYFYTERATKDESPPATVTSNG